jgi:hypothetical protein
MKKLISSLCAATVASTFVLGTMAPLNAAPLVAPRVSAETDIVNVRHTAEHRQEQRERRMERRQDRREFRREARQDRREFRREARQDRREFQRRGDYWYWNGHRGYSYKRPGYRYYDGFWFPLAAFAATAIIASQPRVVVRVSDAHVSWCYDRWRSYREYDNTYQPYNGPRRQCVSPYS